MKLVFFFSIAHRSEKLNSTVKRFFGVNTCWRVRVMMRGVNLYTIHRPRVSVRRWWKGVEVGILNEFPRIYVFNFKMFFPYKLCRYKCVKTEIVILVVNFRFLCRDEILTKRLYCAVSRGRQFLRSNSMYVFYYNFSVYVFGTYFKSKHCCFCNVTCGIFTLLKYSKVKKKILI